MTPAALLKTAARPLIDFALPPRCPACGVVVEDDGRFCAECWRGLDHLGEGCASCGDPSVEPRDAGELCAACLAWPPAFDTARAAVAYGEAARTIALRLKYGGRIGLARTIAGAMQRQMAGFEDAVLVPVPLHRRRIWSRGFNQAALIARALARDAPEKLRLDWLARIKPTPVLRGMNRAERAKAVRGAFKVNATRDELAGRRIVLVDDVHTSGATANACARALKRRGAAEVHLRCWARVARSEMEAY